jgi:hypothetical protein
MKSIFPAVVFTGVFWGAVMTLSLGTALALPPDADPSAPPAGDKQPLASRVGISGGMGVSYVTAQDVVDLINAAAGGTERVPEFKAGVEFFGTLVIPLSHDWACKMEYAYLLYSFNTNSLYGPGEFTVAAHLPTVIGQFTLIDGGTYNVKVGAGVGYHFGTFTEKYFSIDDRYSGKGVGTLLDLEANTAFSENFYGYLGGNLRWDFIGKLTDATGREASITAAGPAATLHFFSIGAKLGFTYYF